jgi:hypothetical protein
MRRSGPSCTDDRLTQQPLSGSIGLLAASSSREDCGGGFGLLPMGWPLPRPNADAKDTLVNCFEKRRTLSHKVETAGWRAKSE